MLPVKEPKKPPIRAPRLTPVRAASSRSLCMGCLYTGTTQASGIHRKLPDAAAGDLLEFRSEALSLGASHTLSQPVGCLHNGRSSILNGDVSPPLMCSDHLHGGSEVKRLGDHTQR
jgi:hypothetical protein